MLDCDQRGFELVGAGAKANRIVPFSNTARKMSDMLECHSCPVKGRQGAVRVGHATYLSCTEQRECQFQVRGQNPDQRDLRLRLHCMAMFVLRSSRVRPVRRPVDYIGCQHIRRQLWHSGRHRRLDDRNIPSVGRCPFVKTRQDA